VKKVNSVQWVEADYRTVLDKGRSGANGLEANARITFADGTIYTVKPDTPGDRRGKFHGKQQADQRPPCASI